MNFDVNELLKLDINKLLKRKDIAIGLAILVSTLFVARIVYMKQMSRVTSLKHKLQEQMEVSKLLSELDKLEADFENLKKDITIGPISTVSVVDLINDLAKKRGISISSINPKKQVDRGLYWEYTFEIEMDASYLESKELLSDIENSRNFFKVDSLSVNSVAMGAKKGSKQTRARMTISAISWKK